MSPNRLLPTTTSSESGAVTKARCQSVHVVLRQLDIRELRTDLCHYLVPQHSAVLKRVGLRCTGELPAPPLRLLEGEARHSFDAPPCKD